MGRRAAPVPLEDRILDAGLRCIARWGISKTTLDDLARQAGCSRATLYRAFPGGREAVLRALVAREVERLVAAVRARMDAAVCLEECLVGGIHEAATRVADHDALQFVLAYEPDLALPHMAFAALDRVLAAAAAVAAPALARWLGDDAGRAAGWVCRLMASYLTCPSDEVDLTDEASVRRLTGRFLLPALARPVPAGGPSDHPTEPAPSGPRARGER